MTNSTASRIENIIINSFNAAVINPENYNEDGSINWSFVDADMCNDLNHLFTFDYIGECLDTLADRFMAYRNR
tara:strand:- start:1185 stop:1403 length:219 start_codon:yes stop_codon:yes gene_type:complete